MILPLLKVNILIGLFIHTIYTLDLEDIMEDRKYRINSCPCGLSEMEFKKEYRYGQSHYMYILCVMINF